MEEAIIASSEKKGNEMKKIAITMALSMMATLVMADHADANDNGWYALGGVVGGLVLGEILQDNRRPVYPAYPAYVEEPVYERQCYARWVRVWDDYRNRWIKVRKTRCEVVRVY